MASVEYDMESEMKKEEKKISKLLTSFPDVEGLEDILRQTLGLYDSKPFNSYTKNVDSFIESYMNEKGSSVNPNDLEQKISIYKNAKILEKSKRLFGRIQRIWGDTITFEHFEVIFTLCLYIISYKKSIDEIILNDVFYLTEKLMSLGYDFDKDVDFSPISEDFFRDLNGIKWDKRAEKLFDKVYSIHGDMLSYIIAETLSSLFYHNVSNNRFILTFLAACNAVNNGRDRMVSEDVVLAYKTFYKLFDADINDLI